MEIKVERDFRKTSIFCAGEATKPCGCWCKPFICWSERVIMWHLSSTSRQLFAWEIEKYAMKMRLWCICNFWIPIMFLIVPPVGRAWDTFPLAKLEPKKGISFSAPPHYLFHSEITFLLLSIIEEKPGETHYRQQVRGWQLCLGKMRRCWEREWEMLDGRFMALLIGRDLSRALVRL